MLSHTTFKKRIIGTSAVSCSSIVNNSTKKCILKDKEYHLVLYVEIYVNKNKMRLLESYSYLYFLAL